MKKFKIFLSALACVGILTSVAASATADVVKDAVIINLVAKPGAGTWRVPDTARGDGTQGINVSYHTPPFGSDSETANIITTAGQEIVKDDGAGKGYFYKIPDNKTLVSINFSMVNDKGKTIWINALWLVDRGAFGIMANDVPPGIETNYDAGSHIFTLTIPAIPSN